MDVLRRHEEDGGQRSNVHLGDRDGEDKEPGEDAGYRVDHSQDGITQTKPQISADAPLQRFKNEQTKITNLTQADAVKALKLIFSPSDLRLVSIVVVGQASQHSHVKAAEEAQCPQWGHHCPHCQFLQV